MNNETDLFLLYTFKNSVEALNNLLAEGCVDSFYEVLNDNNSKLSPHDFIKIDVDWDTLSDGILCLIERGDAIKFKHFIDRLESSGMSKDKVLMTGDYDDRIYNGPSFNTHVGLGEAALLSKSPEMVSLINDEGVRLRYESRYVNSNSPEAEACFDRICEKRRNKENDNMMSMNLG